MKVLCRVYWLCYAYEHLFWQYACMLALLQADRLCPGKVRSLLQCAIAGSWPTCKLVDAAGVQEANGQEPILQAPPWVRPQVTLGCTLKEALAHLSPSLQQGHTGQHGSEASSAPHSHSGQEAAASSLQQPGSAVSELKEGTLEALRALTQVYQQKDYMLVWSGGAAKVLLRDGISGSDTIRPLLQVAPCCSLTELLRRRHGLRRS